MIKIEKAHYPKFGESSVNNRKQMAYHFGAQEKELITFIFLLLFPSLCLRYCVSCKLLIMVWYLSVLAYEQNHTMLKLIINNFYDWVVIIGITLWVKPWLGSKLAEVSHSCVTLAKFYSVTVIDLPSLFLSFPSRMDERFTAEHSLWGRRFSIAEATYKFRTYHCPRDNAWECIWPHSREAGDT